MINIKEIIESRNYQNMTTKPKPGEYVITGIQVGNLQGEKSWNRYIGYVVQIRKEAGSFGSDMVLLRHPDGKLCPHHNQSYHRMDKFWLEKAKELFPKEMTPDKYEDYSKPYTVDNRYPEVGKIIEKKKNGPPVDNSPLMKITNVSSNGNKTIEIV